MSGKVRFVTPQGVLTLMVFIFAAASPVPLVAQVDSSWMAGTTRVVPGPHYEAGSLHRFFLGDHYRELWTRDLVVPVLDLDGFAGGIVPICRGGGFQTLSLRFEAKDGFQYVFRSVDKDPTAKLPVMLRETFVADVLQDQISSHHPAGAVVVAPLLDAVGVLHATPRLVLMPDDPALGAFRSTYGGLLGLIEERPADQPGFGGSNQISSTERVWNEIEESPENQIDHLGFLRARLMDMLVGDWDRHYDQWRWARFRTEDGFVWRPIPRDRDQAFSRLDGLILDLARQNIRELVTFEDTYPDIFGLTWTGRAIDRRFLSGLSWEDWQGVVQDIQRRLTDDIIDNAVNRLPREIYETDGANLVTALRNRRDQLGQAARDFYEILAEYVDIRATDRDELAEVQRLDDEHVRVRLFRRDGASSSAPYFERTFQDSETDEIRLYLQGGDDRAIVGGPGGANVLVRIIGGGGDDAFVDSARVGSRIRTKFYDARGENDFQRGLAASFDRRRFRPPEVEIQVADRAPEGACGDSIPEAAERDLALPFRDWGSQWMMLPWTSLQPDLGLFLGFGSQRIEFGFRRAPYKSKQSFRFGFASGPGRFRAEYDGDFRGILHDAGAHVGIRYSGIDRIRFHGFGNETVTNAPEGFYSITLQQLAVAPSLTWHFSPVVSLATGPRVKYAKPTLGVGNIIDAQRPLGTESTTQFGFQASLLVDSRDEEAAPYKGIYVAVEGFAYRSSVADSVEYAGASVEARTYLTAMSLPMTPTLALRVGGKHLWGTYPYYDAAYLSGSDNLRGFAEQRFAGDAAVFGNAELRLRVGSFRLLLPGQFGLFGLVDAGRVFLDGESSNAWHTSGGGGIWFAFIDRASTISVAVTRSNEKTGFYLRLGFAY